MKKILLSSAAIVAFAGAAAAEVSWSGKAEIGYNDDYEDGFYIDSDIYITASQELNNGWTAELTFGIELNDTNNDDDEEDGFNADDNDLTLSIYNDIYNFTYGDTEYAPISYWRGVSDMVADGVNEYDDESVVRFDADFGTIKGGISATVDNDTGDLYSVGVGFQADFDTFYVSGIYQEEDEDLLDACDADGLPAGCDPDTIQDDDILDNLAQNGGDLNGDGIWGLSVGTVFAGADVRLAYASNDTDDTESVGVQVSYPIGPVTLTGYYVSEDQDRSWGDDYTYGLTALYADGPVTVLAHYESYGGEEEYNLEGAYDFGYGLVVTAGYIDGDDEGDDDFATYVVAEYDLGGGASFLASYADANSDAAESTDDIDTGVGGYELYSGGTLALTFEF
ncbi:porin [Celeribacter indicus]|uniref:Porin n=1 Tax=Celeribacter indicus TaxID=1208324 RepID=A0A0B5DWN0_9RHOB|nr:porin [Celeribacter indicus]AJE45121.1 porin [Celeribacter indicus]SDX26992.1 porin [Celeribacter indicus]